MMLKYLHWLGIAACITLIVSCFLPWVYYADINQTFTGFYSYQNQYGRPGKLLVILGLTTLVCILLPKLWAKRANLFFSAMLLAYAIKTFILFTSCYNAYCPEKRTGIWLILFLPTLILAAAIFPKLKLKNPLKQ